MRLVTYQIKCFELFCKVLLFKPHSAWQGGIGGPELRLVLFEELRHVLRTRSALRSIVFDTFLPGCNSDFEDTLTL